MPLISVIMCNYNCAVYLSAAISSALQQENLEIEVIVVDDGSTDNSREIAAKWADSDPRVRLLVTPSNLGPAGARNLGLAAARGDWIAIQDSDDLMHPMRLASLVATAESHQADIVADDLLAFDDTRVAPAYGIVDGYWSRDTIEMPLETYIESNALYTRAPTLGYLKPVFRASILATGGFRYNEKLRVAEDFDLVLRMMASGHRLMMTPDPTYFYRRRSTSISHRLAPEAVAAMRVADRQFRGDFPNLTPPVVRALDRRMRNLGRTLGFEQMVDRLKARDLRGFVRLARTNPGSLPLLRLPVLARFGRLLRKHDGMPPPPADGHNIAFITRQRIVGPTNGSSTYVLSMLAALRAKQFRLHYICPSPTVFGSWPVLRLRPEMEIFDSITIRGGWRRGNLVIATDPVILLRAAGRVAETIAIKARLLRKPILGAAPYAIAAPLLQKDQLFLASHAPSRADQIICDYAFLTAAIPFVLRPDARSMVVMHDLFSSRGAQFADIGAADSVASLDREQEVAMLARANVVVAIQSDEGEVVAGHLGKDRVIVAPMAMQAVAAPHPGAGTGRVLFVGSRTAPNIDAINWFLAEVWPDVRDKRPDAVFDIVGSVGAALQGPLPAGASVHGLVASLEGYYETADVVVSPLRVGSGLKIKLVEALASGKAIVATTVTCQGVEAEVDGAVIVADAADDTTRHILTLLNDPTARAALASRALTAARVQFGAERCYGGVVEVAQANARRFGTPREAAST